MEKLLNFSLRDLYRHPSPKRAKRAVLRLRRILSKRFHAAEDDVYISQKLNELIWAKGFSKVPRVIPLRIVQEEGKVRAYLQDEKIEIAKKKETKKETKEAPKETKEVKEPKAKVPKEKPAEKKEPTKEPSKEAKTTQTKREEASEKEEEQKKLKEKRLKEKAAEKAAIKRKLDK
jgi:ribosomal protein L31E